ncbi:hypothetical protein BT1A1_3472 [Caldibacillus thermoamylovorans]|uniref:ESAT-6-like protein n=1 Tax=Caldibacillus thermoamylovorans TaxID=35841 RepID=A0A090J3K4_9BACI|nr:hypothetical protein [Caldibacillus thermoamylovorans]CEE03253.1 hypothetical protein BT1A1_3472 [Caldibacillus thermoamylovorans]
MGEKIVINTDMVEKTAVKIREINNRIKDDFADVETAIRKLDSSWNSQAGKTVIGKFYNFRDQYSDARYQVVNDFSKILMQQVSPDYQKTEKANESLADAFK